MRKTRLRSVLLTLLGTLLWCAAGVKADPAPVTYGWDDWTNFKSPSRNYTSPVFSDDDRLYGYRSGLYTFTKETVNGVSCITQDFEDKNFLYVKIPQSAQGATLTVEGFCGIDDDYSDHKGMMQLWTATKYTSPTYFDTENGELLLNYAENGKIVETGESYGVQRPFAITKSGLSEGWVEIRGMDMYISKITVTYYNDYNGTVKVNGELVAGAEIGLWGESVNLQTVTDENGAFTMGPIPAGTYKVNVSYGPDIEDYRGEITFSNTAYDINYELSSRVRDGKHEHFVNLNNVTRELEKGGVVNALGDNNRYLIQLKEGLVIIPPDAQGMSPDHYYNAGEEYGKDGRWGLSAARTKYILDGTMGYHIGPMMFVNRVMTGGQGEFTFEAKRTGTSAVVLDIYKMIKQEDGTYAKGDLIRSYSEETNSTSKLTPKVWTKIVLDNLTEDCYIGIEAGNVYLCDFQNFYTPDEAVYEAKAVYNLDYVGSQLQPYNVNPMELRDGVVLYTSNRYLYNTHVSARRQEIAIGNTGEGFAIIPVSSTGKARLKFKVSRSAGNVETSATSLNIHRMNKCEDGTYVVDYLAARPVSDGIVTDTGTPVYTETENAEDKKWHEVTVDLPEAGYYAFQGMLAGVKDIELEYVSGSVEAGGKVWEGETVLAGVPVKLTGPAGCFDAVSGEDGTFAFANVRDGRYEVTSTYNGRVAKKVIYINNGEITPALDLVYEQKPEGYREDREDFEWVTPADYIAMSKETWPVNGVWYSTADGWPSSITFSKGYGSEYSYGAALANSTKQAPAMLVRQIKGSEEGGGIRFLASCDLNGSIHDKTHFYILLSAKP